MITMPGRSVQPANMNEKMPGSPPRFSRFFRSIARSTGAHGFMPYSRSVAFIAGANEWCS
jgi:hypothetical protein